MPNALDGGVTLAERPVDDLYTAVARADILRIDLYDPAREAAAVASLIEDLTRAKLRPAMLAIRTNLESITPQAAPLAALKADQIEIRVPQSNADSGFKSKLLAEFTQLIKKSERTQLRAVIEVSRQTVGRLAHLVDLAVDAGFFAVCFEPLFVTEESCVADSVFFDQTQFNDDLEQALRTGKRRNVFVDAVKFGSQGRALGGVQGRRLQLVMQFTVDGSNSDAWLAGRGKKVATAKVGALDIVAIEPSFRHMDVDATHFGPESLRSAPYLSRKAALATDDNFVASHGPLLKRFGLDPQLYVSAAKLVGLRLPTNITAGEGETIAELNHAIEAGFAKLGKSRKQRVLINLTEPFVGINWGKARNNLLPDQRQFWRTFNQWQLPTVYASIEPGKNYVVRSVIHDATPGDAIDFLQVSCNGFVPRQQFISWEGMTCVHVCMLPAAVVSEANGELSLSFAITRQSDDGSPAEVGLRTITIDADDKIAEVGHPLRRALSRLHSMIKNINSVAPDELERRNGYGRVVPSSVDPALNAYLISDPGIVEGVSDINTIVDGQQPMVAAFAGIIAGKIRQGDLSGAADRILATMKEIVEKRLDWIKVSPVEHRYIDTSLGYEFFSVIRKVLERRLPGEQAVKLFETLLEKNAGLRPACLAIADHYLESRLFDEAISAARGATHRDACCVISQEVLRKIYRAKFPDTKNTVIDGVPLYDLSERFCSTPFDRIETAKDGIVWTCCPAWLGAPVGNMHRMKWESAWNSDQAGLMRESILDGSFKYCNSGVCPAILGGSLPKKQEVTDPYFRHYIDNNIVKPPESPREISISHDPSCNLACPQCRKDFILADDKKNDEYDATISQFIQPLIDMAQIDSSTVLMSGDGEIFVSPHYRKVLKLFDPELHSNVGINLLSNGLLFENNWNKFANIHNLVRSVTISTDGASEAVFKETRGGSWDKLYRNLKFIGGLRRSGQISRFNIHYAVQTCNYKDMVRMIEIGHEINVDRIAFAILRNSGVYEPDDYAKRCIFEASHPEHPEFVKYLEDPIFKSPIADLTQFAGFRADAVVN